PPPPPPPPLPPFPTRRSSDPLAGCRNQLSTAAIGQPNSARRPSAARQLSHSMRQNLPMGADLLYLRDAYLTRFTSVVTAVAGERDRKSTRLNSSHRQISYAVF